MRWGNFALNLAHGALDVGEGVDACKNDLQTSVLFCCKTNNARSMKL